jgi:hypothetical protein
MILETLRRQARRPGNNALKKRAYHSVGNMLRYLAKKKQIAAEDLRDEGVADCIRPTEHLPGYFPSSS